MKVFIKILRQFVLIMFLMLASIGVGLSGAILPNFYRYDNHKTTVEWVDKREDEISEEEEKK